MHPPLHKPHPECASIVKALETCHAQNQYAKFWGACNDAKVELDWCFRREKDTVRKANNRNEWQGEFARFQMEEKERREEK